MSGPISAGCEAPTSFADAVSKEFAFLLELGLTLIEANPTIVQYGKGDLHVVVYHGRQSYEIGLQIALADEQYSMSEIIRSVDAAAAAEYRNFCATTPDAVVAAVGRLASLARTYGDRAFRGDPAYYAQLRRQRHAWSDAYSLDVLVNQVRPRAEAAFREGRYREAADLFEQVLGRLTPAELKKWNIARRRG